MVHKGTKCVIIKNTHVQILEVFMGQKLLRKYAKDKDNILLPDIICLSTFYDTAKGASQNHQD